LLGDKLALHLQHQTGTIARGRRRRFFRASALASAKPKKERESAKKKECEKSESAKRERKKWLIHSFSSPHSGNPVSEPKAARQGESKGLECSSVGMLKLCPILAVLF
jgi:hypothetical protein